MLEANHAHLLYSCASAIKLRSKRLERVPEARDNKIKRIGLKPIPSQSFL